MDSQLLFSVRLFICGLFADSVLQIMRVITSSPAKAILFGEHSVVYNRKALAVAVGRRLKVSFNSANFDGDQNKDILLLLDFPCLSKTSYKFSENMLNEFLSITSSIQSASSEYFDSVKNWMSKTILDGPYSVIYSCAAVFVIIFFRFNGSIEWKNFPLHVKVHSDIPLGAGLGSSAALCSTVAASWLVLRGDIPIDSSNWTPDNRQNISSLAFVGEQLMHASPSGMDNTICTFGGTVLFSRVSELHLTETRCQYSLLVVNTKVERSTKDLVQGVRQRWEVQKDKFESYFSQIESIVLRANELLCGCNDRGDHNMADDDIVLQLSKLTTENQKLLEMMGVSHESIAAIIDALSQYGLAAKLTGAGGGGCVISFLPPPLVARRSCWECWRRKIGRLGPLLLVPRASELNVINMESSFSLFFVVFL